MLRLRNSIFMLSCCVILPACFGINRDGGIMRHHKGVIYSTHSRFVTGKLSEDWKGPKIRIKHLVYENNKIQGTIVADALCGPKFDDAPLPRLANSLFPKSEKSQIKSQKEIKINEHQALRTQGEKNIDGVRLLMDSVVLKQGFCLYDFLYFAPPEEFSKGESDFEGFFYGFEVR